MNSIYKVRTEQSDYDRCNLQFTALRLGSCMIRYFSSNAVHSRIVSLLKAISSPIHLKQAHGRIITQGLQCSPSILSATTLSYIHFSLLDSALLVFRYIPNPSDFLWNMMIRSSATHGQFQISLLLYSKLLSSCLPPGKFAFPFALKSCAGLSDLQRGRQIHKQSISFACAQDLFVDAALVDMYCKCGDVQSARQVFDRMTQRDLVSWTAMVSGYAHNGCSIETLEFFKLMQDADVKATRVGLLSVFLACGQLGALSKGECFHGYVIQTGFQEDISVLTAVLDMYAKCGNLTTARMVFHGAGGKDVVCWSAMIASYGYHGLGKEAVSTLNQMMDAGVMPNDATFTSILSACSHSGLFEEGRLKEAQEFMEQMPMAPNSSLLGSLLGACRVHGDLELGEKIADRILDSDPRCSGYYVILSNMYASRSRWNHIEKLRKRMSGRQVCKEQGISFIEFHHQIHKFGVGDRSHPQSEEIYSYLDKLLTRMKQLGYIPQLEFSLHDVEDENKELALSYHSERLAIAFGLINTIPGTPIRVMKN